MADTIAIPRVGILPSGPLNAITDVAGTSVGHTTLDRGGIQTGVTVLLPQSDNLFMQKVPAGLDVINGFGKSVGLMQVQELGVLESPIALVNTFSVSVASTALILDGMALNPELGRNLPTLNPLVFECNDGWLNDARSMSLQTSHVQDALTAEVAPRAKAKPARTLKVRVSKVKAVKAKTRVVKAPAKAPVIVTEAEVDALMMAVYGTK